MKLLVEPRVTIGRSAKLFMRYGRLVNLTACMEMIKRLIEPARNVPTGRKLRATVLPRTPRPEIRVHPRVGGSADTGSPGGEILPRDSD